LKFPYALDTVITGVHYCGDSVALTNGWNLVGSATVPVPVSSIMLSGDATIGNFFGYANGYDAISQLEPTGGYWVKASGSGSLSMVLFPGTFPGEHAAPKIVPSSEMPPAIQVA
jgi:hypothetical protein